MKKFLLKILFFPLAMATWLGYALIGLVVFEDWGEYSEEILGFWGWYFFP